MSATSCASATIRWPKVQYVLAYHPSQNELLLAKYQRMGEFAFCADQGRLAREWIAQNPGKFALISLRRVYFFWNGIPRLAKTSMAGRD